ncbi:hypothetical protein SELMODRAFT_419116 [Selaginella moellendorffii]|uniref:Uncharacterized protein n=1 Tax=Selaginella moellendorffii TaxID=88036 RepID=D8S7W5_SELML|nr:hypothetical protein SELMODRAFT_419116 [Selaginella moellendorffii]
MSTGFLRFSMNTEPSLAVRLPSLELMSEAMAIPVVVIKCNFEDSSVQFVVKPLSSVVKGRNPFTLAFLRRMLTSLARNQKDIVQNRCLHRSVNLTKTVELITTTGMMVIFKLEVECRRCLSLKQMVLEFRLKLATVWFKDGQHLFVENWEVEEWFCSSLLVVSYAILDKFDSFDRLSA